MNILFLALALLGYAASFCLFLPCFKKINIIPYIAVSMMLFLCSYTVISCVLLFFDIFQVEYSLLIHCLYSFVLIVRLRKKIAGSFAGFDFNLKPYLAILLIVLTFSVFTWKKSESIAPQFDAGVYGTKAIALISGNTKIHNTIEEYFVIENEQNLMELQDQSIGLYKDGSLYEHEYHALPTWPALMALFGKCLGLFAMGHALTALYSCSIVILYCIIEQTTKNPYAKYLAAVIYGFSPLTIYLAKNILSEMALTAFFLFAVFLFLQQGNRVYLTLIPLFCMCFTHLTMFVYLPLLYSLILLVFLKTNQRVYAWTNILFSVLFLLSLIYSQKTSPIYFRSQMRNELHMSVNTAFVVFLIGIVLMAAIQYAAVKYYDYRYVKSLRQTLIKYLQPILFWGTLLLLAITAVQGYRLGFTDAFTQGRGIAYLREFYGNQGIVSLVNLTIVSVMFATGLLAPLVILFLIVRKKTEFSFLQQMFILAFLYCLSVYTIIRPDNMSNYYTSRYYFIFLIPFTVLAIASLLRGKKLIIGFIGVTICYNMVFNLTLYQIPEYGGNHMMLESALTVIPKNAIVALDKDLNYRMTGVLTTNLRNYNNNLVFTTDDIEELERVFPNRDIYIIRDNTIDWDSDDDLYLDKLLYVNFTREEEIVRQAKSKRVYYLAGRNYPSEFAMHIYQLNAKKSEFEFTPQSIFYFQDFYTPTTSTKGVYFAFSKDVSHIRLNFEPKELNLIQIHYLDLNQYVFDNLGAVNVKIYSGDTLLFSTDINEYSQHNQTNVMDFIVPGYLLSADGLQEFRIETQTWIPEDYDRESSDDRSLGFPASKVVLLDYLDADYISAFSAEKLKEMGAQGLYDVEMLDDETVCAWSMDKVSVNAQVIPKEYNSIQINYLPLPGELQIPLQIEIFMDGERIKTQLVSAQQDESFVKAEIPPELLSEDLNHEFEITVDTWRPRDLFADSEDERDIGICITNIALQ